MKLTNWERKCNFKLLDYYAFYSLVCPLEQTCLYNYANLYRYLRIYFLPWSTTKLMRSKISLEHSEEAN